MKILIIGASGYLGNTIYKKLKDCSNDTIYGTCYTSSSKELLQVNVLDKVNIQKLLLIRPDIIIWSIYDPEREIDLSQIGISEIVKGISKDVRLIYVSTTVGKGKNQTEDVVPHKRKPDEYLSRYINGKIQGEVIVKNHFNYVIVRPGSIYGYDYDGKRDVRMEELLEMYRQGETYSRTANMYVSFVNVEDLANAIIELAHSDFNGIVNVAGENPVSHYDFNRQLAKLMNINDSFIVPDYKEENIYHNLSNDKRKSVIKTYIREIED